MSKRYTKEEDEFIKNNYLTMTDEEIGKILGRNGKSINTRRTNHLKLIKLKKNNTLKSKFTIEDIKNEFLKFDYKLESNEYKNNRIKLIICDNEGYYYYVSYDTFKSSKNNVKKFHKNNPYTIQNIRLWCKLNNKPFELLSDTYENNNKYLKWKCLKGNCGEEFKATWHNIQRGDGCGVCHGKQVGLSNCLATLRPDLVKEWHPTKNGNLTPYNVTVSSNQYIYWKCSKNFKHEWGTLVSGRSSGSGCPYCLGMLPTEEYNLLIINPELCKEWDYKKNKNKPEEYCPNSGEYVWWKCKECGYEWNTRIADRNSGKGCIECSKSKGEKKIKNFFDINDIYYIPQKEFDGLLGLKGGNLSYDFYLPNYNLLIEYQGEQHEKYIPGFHKSKKDFEKQLEHDRKKREYAQNYNINLFEIWYWDFKRIEEILDNYLKIILI